MSVAEINARVNATVCSRTSDDKFVFDIEVSNFPIPTYALAEVAYPRFKMRPYRNSTLAQTDNLIYPNGGLRIYQPGTFNLARTGQYPGPVPFQFLARYDGLSGIYMATEDTAAHVKTFTAYSQQHESVSMGIQHLTPELRNVSRVRIPYSTVLTTFEGDWMHAADIYRRWATQQWWCATPLALRSAIPGFLTNGSGLIIASINNESGYNNRFGPGLEALPAYVQTYREKSGLKQMILVPYGWEHNGIWAGIDYLPAVPSMQAWNDTIVKLKAQGDRAAFLVSGFWFVVKREASSMGPAFDHTAQQEQLRDSLTIIRNGSVAAMDDYDLAHAAQPWRGYSVRLCHGAQQSRDILSNIFIELAKLGVSLVSFDQEIGGGQVYPCYATDHGHPPGYGPWMQQGFADTLTTIRRATVDQGHEFGMLTERVSELSVPLLATFWSRQFAQQDWMVYDGYGEPIFNYLYHDYITTIAAAMVQGQGDGQPGYMLRRAVIADSLTRGMIMGPFDHDVSLTPTTAWQANLSTLFFNLTRAYVAHSAYVSLGQMVRPPACSNCSVVQTYLYRGEKKVDVNTSGVRLGAFKSNDTIGVVMVNIMNEDTTVLVDLNLYTEPRYLGKPDLNVTIMTLDGVRRQTTATQAKIAVFVPATDGAVLVVE
eukprot:TRINITY_DN10507_c0_g1_i3.p1 TRINITY_DN10507_c0_g1~~TRINITY_DN10507_c0_g1_i3.p1  ORF type:complete len:759 (+),score=181.62 TRINITY_DN10507_c0_g1_i3:321-2279(+)